MSNSIALMALLFSRLAGFFLFSPLFADKAIPYSVRFGLAVALSMMLAPPLTGISHALFDNSNILHIKDLGQFFLLTIFELLFGYVLGFIFSIVFEAAAFAGQVIGVLMGFSATELLDPLTSNTHPLFARFLSLFTFALFLIGDLHHLIIEFLYTNFEILPPGLFGVQLNLIKVAEASTLLFKQALSFMFYPLLFLLFLIALFAVFSRFFSIFWIGFPLQLMIGLWAMGKSMIFFPHLLNQFLGKFVELVKKFVVNF